MLRKKPDIRRSTEAVTLRNVAEYVGLAPCSVSAILNNSAAGMSIPQQTKDRVLRTATRLNYRPNYSARSLRTKRTYTVAVLALDIGRAPAARIIAGAEGFLRANGYSLLITTYDAAPDWFENHFTQLRQRGVEGIISVQTKPPLPSEFPMVFIDLLAVKFLEPIPVIMQLGLRKAGQEAAEHVVRRIEQKNMRFSGIGSSLVSLAGEGGPAARTGARPQSPAHFAG
jgi:DNA-binding LacI/PurR family transcriptional regulator